MTSTLESHRPGLAASIDEAGSAPDEQTRARAAWQCRRITGRHVLALGTGGELVASLLAGRGCRLLVLHRDPDAVEHSRRRAADGAAPDVEFVRGDLWSDVLDERAPFDTLLLTDGPDFSARSPEAVERAWSLLRPGGRLVLAARFGAGASGDGEPPYYLREPALSLSSRFEIEELEFLPGMLGVAARRPSHGGAPALSMDPRLSGLESMFADIERELRSRLSEAEYRLREQHAAVSRLAAERERLERALQAKSSGLEAQRQRTAGALQRVERMQSSTSFRIGAALSQARSPAHALRLPAELWRIYRDAVMRRKERQRRRPEARRDEGGPRLAAPAPRPLEAAMAAPADAAAMRQLRVACVMDEFTFHAFQPECLLDALLPATWRDQLERQRPDLLFIESAWRGTDDLWLQKVSNPSPEIMSLIDWCYEQGVPTVFWNKEDPVHFGGFLHIARAVDYVFTTDIDCIARYKREVGHERVYLLPFAAQPAAHNPIERFERKDAFCFAGSYYLKYPERQRDFASLIDVVRERRPVEIFDRNYHKPHPHYEFPPAYQPLIVGNLPFDQIDKAYKGYRYGINMNTIKQSQTMFARRVFELLASNTVVVSNYSRGVRALFADLVICSDASSEIRRRLDEVCGDETVWRKFRLAGLRKVMREHTYAHRLAYIVSKVAAAPVTTPSPAVCAVAWPRDADEAAALVQAFRRQRCQPRHLCLVGAALPTSLAAEDVSLLGDARELAAHPRYAACSHVAPLSARDYHGPHYLLDLQLAAVYAPGQAAVGKATVYRGDAHQAALQDDGRQYRPVEELPLRSSLLTRERFESLGIAGPDALEQGRITGGPLLCVDEFNYACDVTAAPSEAVRSLVDDLPHLRSGPDCSTELLPLAEAIGPAAPGGEGATGDLPSLTAAELAAWLPPGAPAELRGDRLHVRCTLDADRHSYLYFKRVFTREELNLVTNSRVELLCEGDVDLRTVFEFLDGERRKISHAILRTGSAHSIAIPAHCVHVRFGLRLQGRGTARIERLVLGDQRTRPSAVLPSARHLVVLKQYPSYEDLYKYGFVHSRVRAYLDEHRPVDVFRLVADEACSWREFENVDVTTGDRDLLDLALQRGGYRHVMAHLMDRSMWEVFQRHLDRVKLTVWIHGAEIQVWQRREFEFERMDAAEVARQKALSDRRRAFWREVLLEPHRNLQLVFVSQHFAEEVAADLDIDLSRLSYRIVHNFIDPQRFPYREKSPEMRKRVLSIRPFASRKYANDLSVQAILRLSREPWFGELEFCIVGDGELFDEITAPLWQFPNVRLERRFLTQGEIAQLHAQYGVFLCPTRMDAQGVSRDEAMSSGLVPVTSAVAAVPEFVDASCGFLAPAEDHEALADAIATLYRDPQRFLSLSKAAAQRVRAQSGFEQTIRREMEVVGL